MIASFESRRRAAALAALVAACCVSASGAQQVDQAMRASEEKNDSARQAQGQIDRIVDRTDELEDEYINVTKEVDGLRVYNRLLGRQIEDQERELEQLAESMNLVTNIERQVTPLMLRMIEALERFVELDMPFLMEERRNRVDDLREMMERADVSVAEKMRRVLEAYQIENEYGRSIEAYKGMLELDGVERQVDFLRIGRIGLYYQTEDGERSGRWDGNAGEWVELGGGHRRDIRDGLRIARKQVAPDLLMLPIPVPGAGEGGQ